MRSLAAITPLVISYNEEANIDRVLSHLTWADRVVVLDSGSTDRTRAMCGRYPNVELLTRPFDSFASQCNYGLTQISSEWCLSIDADYVVPEATALEMQDRIAEAGVDGFEARLVYCIRGRPLRRAILPNRVVLFRTRLGRYEQDGHAHRLKFDGSLSVLRSPVLHDDRKPIGRWLASQQTYAEQEAHKISSLPIAELNWADRVRRLKLVAPLLVPSFYLFYKGGIFEGWPGFDYAAQRAVAELVLTINLIEKTRLNAAHSDDSK